tara:strand:+ start:2491 stop:2658 length:168 start_codon:yes stop_codon:yes gene_type:complete
MKKKKTKKPESNIEAMQVTLQELQKKWYDTKNEEERTELGIQIIELKEEINQLNK